MKPKNHQSPESVVREILSISDRVYVFKLGRIAFEGTPDELWKEGDIHKALFDLITIKKAAPLSVICP